jgi:dimethylglycine dehydrogenase
MKSHARVVVIGGGIIGCSVLYHLTRLGWHDVVLVERDELTSGSTWHAAGQNTLYWESAFLTRVAMESLNLYRNL